MKNWTVSVFSVRRCLWIRRISASVPSIWLTRVRVLITHCWRNKDDRVGGEEVLVWSTHELLISINSQRKSGKGTVRVSEVRGFRRPAQIDKAMIWRSGESRRLDTAAFATEQVSVAQTHPPTLRSINHSGLLRASMPWGCSESTWAVWVVCGCIGILADVRFERRYQCRCREKW
jgi:hypothetical protein